MRSSRSFVFYLFLIRLFRGRHRVGDWDGSVQFCTAGSASSALFEIYFMTVAPPAPMRVPGAFYALLHRRVLG